LLLIQDAGDDVLQPVLEIVDSRWFHTRSGRKFGHGSRFGCIPGWIWDWHWIIGSFATAGTRSRVAFRFRRRRTLRFPFASGGGMQSIGSWSQFRSVLDGFNLTTCLQDLFGQQFRILLLNLVNFRNIRPLLTPSVARRRLPGTGSAAGRCRCNGSRN
jgi:hypothetical protein